MATDTSPAKILVLLKGTHATEDFLCPYCGGFIAHLEACSVADLTEPETYALSAVVEHKEGDFLGLPIQHHGRLGDGYCRRKFFFWDINQGKVKITPVVSIGVARAA